MNPKRDFGYWKGVYLIAMVVGFFFLFKSFGFLKRDGGTKNANLLIPFRNHSKKAEEKTMQMKDFIDPMISDFKEKIAFDHEIRKENSEEEVKSTWQFETELLKIGENDWRISDTSYSVWNAGVAKRFLMSSKKKKVGAVIFLSSNGQDSAQRYFLERAVSNTTGGSFFRKCTPKLGTVAVCNSEDVLWVYRNVCIHLQNIDDTPVDLFPIAFWLQSMAEKGVVPKKQATIDLLFAIQHPKKTHHVVGSPFRLEIRPSFDEKRYQIAENHHGDHMWVTTEGNILTVEGKMAGAFPLDVFLIDKQTLLSKHHHLELQFYDQTQLLKTRGLLGFCYREKLRKKSQ
jgi:hypothetical protein